MSLVIFQIKVFKLYSRVRRCTKTGYFPIPNQVVTVSKPNKIAVTILKSEHRYLWFIETYVAIIYSAEWTDTTPLCPCETLKLADGVAEVHNRRDVICCLYCWPDSWRWRRNRCRDPFRRLIISSIINSVEVKDYLNISGRMSGRKWQSHWEKQAFLQTTPLLHAGRH